MQTRFDRDGSILIRLPKDDPAHARMALTLAMHANGHGALLESKATEWGDVPEQILEVALLESGDKPHFTGIDAHGHKWVNGKQVAIGKKREANAKTASAPPVSAKPAAVAAKQPVADDKKKEPKKEDEKGPKKKEEEEKEEKEPPFEWDGEIDPVRVERSVRDRSHIASWDFYGDDNEHFPQSVYLVSADYDPGPEAKELETVYRWESHQDDGGMIDHGDWTTDEYEARRDGRIFARESDQEEPESDDDDDDDDQQDDDDDDDNDDDQQDDDDSDDDDDDDDDSDEVDDSEDDISLPPPPPLPTKKAKIGKSQADVSIDRSVNEKRANDIVTKLFPKDDIRDSWEAIASAVGAPDDAEVTVVSAGKYEKLFSDDTPLNATGIRVSIKHPKMNRFSRFIGIDANGKKFIRNEIIEIKKEYQGEGMGTTIFARQVENAAEEGFDYISTHAAGSKGGSMNGYYTWPRLGYNESLGSIAKRSPKLAAKISDAFPEAKSMFDVMATPEGQKWWEENGKDLYNAKFDLRGNSWSRFKFETYMEEREKRKR